jgi:signal transduction histidine kinase
MSANPTRPELKSPPGGKPLRAIWLGMAVALLTSAAVAVDWFTGPEIAFSIIYFLPVSLAAWRGGRWWGILAAFLSGALWLVIELLSNESYSLTWIPYWNGTVRLTIFLVVATLITEIGNRKRAEVALENQRGILQSILDSMREGIIVSEQNGHLLLLNPMAEEFLDLDTNTRRPATHDELGEALVRNRLLPAEPRENALIKALRGEKISETELLLQVPGYRSRWLRIHSRPWLDPEGRHHGTLVVLSDITARRSLEKQIAEISDREQRRLGQDLHDGLCQHLVSMTFAARMLEDKLKAKALTESEDARRLGELLDNATTQAREVARGLYFVELDSSGLASALEQLVARTGARFPVQCAFEDRCHNPLSESVPANDLFRIAQEAVSNAAKHSNARRITITLESNETEILLGITDDGCGMVMNAQSSPGLGLHMMHYRARVISAKLDIQSKPGAGTTVTCSLNHHVPLDSTHSAVHAA